MTLEDFQAAGLGTLAEVDSSSGACTNCHAAGRELAPPTLDANPAATLAAAATSPSITRWVEVGADLAPAFNPLLIEKGAIAGHPTYTLTPEQEEGLQAFFLATETRYLAGNCQ